MGGTGSRATRNRYEKGDAEARTTANSGEAVFRRDDGTSMLPLGKASVQKQSSINEKEKESW
jgi:hypothetical protein